MNLKDLATVVSKFAPALATSILGPVGGTAVKLLENIFGTGEANLIQTISNDPNAEFKLKELELKHAETLKVLELQSYQTEVEDRKSARAMFDNDNKYEWFVHVLAFLVNVGFFFAVGCVFLTKADSSDHDILNNMIGVLGTVWVMVMSYYFGSMKKH